MPADPTLAEAEESVREKLAGGQIMAALRVAERAVTLHPRNPAAHYLHATVLIKAGRYDFALQAFRTCIEKGGHADARQRVSSLSKSLDVPVREAVPTPCRSWRSGLDHATLASIQNALHNHTYKGVPLLKNPFDLGIYPDLIWKLKPRTILEIGSSSGGSALWMGDMCDAMGLDCRIHSMDVVKVTDVKHRRVTFYEGDGRDPGTTWTPKFLAKLPRPWLVIEDADHTYETSSAVLAFFDPLLTTKDFLVIEDGIISDLSKLPEGSSGPHRALREFLQKRFMEWEIDSDCCDKYGYNFTWCSNGFLRRTGLKRLSDDVAPGMKPLIERIRQKEFEAVLGDLNEIKGTTGSRRGTDYLRAFCFAKLGRFADALEAAKEEIRWFPDHAQARRFADHLSARLFQPPRLGNDEFKQLCAAVRPYTMLSEERLHSLYELARRACVFDVPGDFVECGVAGGGSSALLAAVIAKHSKRPRRLFACDTFSGMPAPTEKDVHGGLTAGKSGWGAGTCAAPTASLMEICGKLGVAQIVTPIQGMFADTLPGLRDSLEAVAFLHMDGDWYESTRDILVNLYDRVGDRAAIQVDDYGFWKGCRDAIHEFEMERGLQFNIHKVDGTGVWFSKPASAASIPHLLNLGCGRTIHPDWLNIDMAPSNPAVIGHNLLEPLPLDDQTCSAVYCSHVLEHLPKKMAPAFVAECFRVLVPGGILRIVVPDLETIARLYLQNLDAACAGDLEAAKRHEWMIIELVDQLARHRSGGEMLDYFRRQPMPAGDFVVERMGKMAENSAAAARAAPKGVVREEPALTAESVGKFRMRGEVHQWMYDRLSLSQLLQEAGFEGFAQCTATGSQIPSWSSYHLDSDESGRVRKPDSLFVEAWKPT
jgi:cephalosporin hydroxylase/predicted SAM-dependent methyltransferase